MKVIKSGDGRKGWSKEIECTGYGNQVQGCGAILLVEQDDLFKTYSHARDETSTFISFRCPECNNLTDISSSEMSSQVIRDIKDSEPKNAEGDR